MDLHLDFVREGAFIVSAVLVGAIVGSLFAGQAADALGPRKALLLNNAWLLVGSILCAASPGGYAGLLAGAQLTGYLTSLPLTCAGLGYQALDAVCGASSSHACLFCDVIFTHPCLMCAGQAGHWLA